jgi:hypothetical protein
MVWKLVKAGEDRPLTAADLALLLRLRFALQEYEADTGQECGKGKRVLQANASGGGDMNGGKCAGTVQCYGYGKTTGISGHSDCQLGGIGAENKRLIWLFL